MKQLLPLLFLLCFQLLARAQQPAPSHLVVSDIRFEGNKVTKPQILHAELKIQVGDTVERNNLSALLEKEALRLYNLQLFHYVRHRVQVEGNTIAITYEMQERWYVWPIPIFSLADRNVNAWIQKMNFDRLDYGIHVAWYNFRGRNENVISNIQHGFNRKYEIFYRIPQVNKAKTLGLDFGVSHYQSHFIDYINDEARPLTLEVPDLFPIQRSYARAGIINRNTVEKINTVLVSFYRQSIRDTVLALNPDYHLGENTKSYVQVEAKKTINRRKNFSYPTSGYFMELGITHKHFFNSPESPQIQLNADYSRYFPLSQRVFYGASALAQWRFSGQSSTSENIALGYKKNIRGFDFYVIDGQHFGLLKQQLTTRFLDKQVHLSFLPSEKFNTVPVQLYIGPFVEAGYVEDGLYAGRNTLSNQLLYSVGLSLHGVSYYDQVFVLDYTLNSLGEHGIFVSTKFPF